MANKPNENTKNYIILAMLRNQKFNQIHIDWSRENNVCWEETNQQLLSIENGLICGLTNLGSKARETIFNEMTEMRDSVLSTYYATELTTDISVEEKLRIMHSCKDIVEGVDYLEAILQIHFPAEFPNELIQCFNNGDQKAQEGASLITEITEAVSETTIEELRSLTPSEPEDTYEDEIESIIPTAKPTTFNFEQPDLIDGMDPGLAKVLYDTKKELTDNFTTMPEGFNNPEALLVNGMDPKLFSTLLEQRELRMAEKADQDTFQPVFSADPAINQ
jgi:hypothetical protein